MNIYVIGHKSPDLDSIVSAISYTEFLKKSKRYEGAKIIPVKADNENKETQFIFKEIGVDIPKLLDDYEVDVTDAFVLVDHNEESQRHEKIIPEQIIEVVDHHKINITFSSPVRIDVKPVGSTSTIIYELFDMYGINSAKETKYLMLAAILSDTQGLKSSTTTGIDSQTAKELAQILNEDIEKLTFDLFKAKSNMSGLSIEEIAEKDFKIFDFGGKKVFINQVETFEPKKVLDKKDGLLEAMDEIKSKYGTGQAYIVVTDIMKVNSQIIYTTEEEKEVLEKAFTGEGANNVIDIGPKMSRKKDIAPAIETVLTS